MAGGVAAVDPVISLGVDSYAHKNKEFGRIKFPVFAPAGYEPKTKFLEALAAAGWMGEARRHAPRSESETAGGVTP